jgi:hypothetical protein
MGGELEAGIDENGVWIDSLAAREMVRSISEDGQ